MSEKIYSQLTDENGIPLFLRRVGDEPEPMTEDQVDIIYSFIMERRKSGSISRPEKDSRGIKVRKEELK